VNDTNSLLLSLKGLEAREVFARNPTSLNLSAFAFLSANSWNNLPHEDKVWWLGVLRSATGENFATALKYNEWITLCEESFPFLTDERRFDKENPNTNAKSECLG
jgi:hypothetical protein